MIQKCAILCANPLYLDINDLNSSDERADELRREDHPFQMQMQMMMVMMKPRVSAPIPSFTDLAVFH